MFHPCKTHGARVDSRHTALLHLRGTTIPLPSSICCTLQLAAALPPSPGPCQRPKHDTTCGEGATGPGFNFHIASCVAQQHTAVPGQELWPLPPHHSHNDTTLCCHQSPVPRLCSSIPSPTQLHTSCARGRLCCTAWRGITRGIACRLQHLASVLAVNTALICRLCLPCSRVVLQAYIPLADPPATSDDSRLHDVPQRAGSEPRPNKVQ